MPALVIVGIIGVAVVAVLIVRRGSRPTQRHDLDRPNSNWANDDDTSYATNSLLAETFLSNSDTFSSSDALGAPVDPTPASGDSLSASYDGNLDSDSLAVASVEGSDDTLVETPDSSDSYSGSDFDSGSSSDDSGSSSSD